MLTTIKTLIRDESGVTAIEYGLIAGLVGVAIVGGLTALEGGLSDIFTGVGDRLGNAADGIGSGSGGSSGSGG